MPNLSDLTTSERIVYDVLLSAAKSAEVAPMNDDIAEAIDASSTSTAPTIIGRLEKKGFLVVKRYQRSREICFPHLGLCTVTPKNTALHWRDRPSATPRPAADLVRQQRPDLAKEIMKEAVARRRPVSEFLADLVFIGWQTMLENEL